MYFVYIIQSIMCGKFYVGCTDNIQRRVGEHNKGLSKYTKTDKPWKLVYSEEFTDLSLARKREYKIKSWHKRSAIESLIKGPIV